MKKIIGIVVVLISLLLLIGCTSTAPTKTTANVPAPAEPTVKAATTEAPAAQPAEPAVKTAATNGEVHQVIIQNFKFSPDNLEIKSGDSVEWVNKDSAAHTVSIPALNVDQKLPAGGTVTQKFTDKGDYGYHCTFHPSMQGTVTVN